ncbi:MAG: phage tail protein, partial [Cyanothece sp. SIO2G6]|nr:phage tail protein [Cyanothece sp. SIO2G6]
LQGQIHIHATVEGSGQRHTQMRPFNVFVRPDSLYLNFLPDFYREVDFIGRYLKIFEQGFEPVVQTLETLWANLDPLTASQAMLPFLAHWVGWPTKVPWDTPTQRRLIRRAMELYRWRGTRRGLRLYLHLYSGLSLDQPDTPEAQRQISIQEIFNEGFKLGRARLGNDTIMGGSRPYHFIVRLRSPHSHPLDETLIRTIIDQEKPAFCTYDLYIESLRT